MSKSKLTSKKIENTLGNYWNTNLDKKRCIQKIKYNKNNNKIELKKNNTNNILKHKKIDKRTQEYKITKEINNIWKCINTDNYEGGEYTLRNIDDNPINKDIININFDKSKKDKYNKCINKNICNICKKDDFQELMLYNDGKNNNILSKIVNNIIDLEPYFYYHKFCLKIS